MSEDKRSPLRPERSVRERLSRLIALVELAEYATSIGNNPANHLGQAQAHAEQLADELGTLRAGWALMAEKGAW